MVAKQLVSHLQRSPSKSLKPSVQRLLRRDASQRSQSSTFEVSPVPTHKSSVSARRRVRFQVDARGEIQPQLHEYQAAEDEFGANDSMRSELYNSKADILKLKQMAHATASGIAAKHPKLVDSLECLTETPLKFRGSRGENMTIEEALNIIECHSNEVRGLESKVCRLLGRHQRWAITAVLRCQLQLQSEGKANRERALRKCCELMSKGPRQVAYMIAKIDEEAARRLYAEKSGCVLLEAIL